MTTTARICALLAILLATPALAVQVTCTGTNDTATLQSALDSFCPSGKGTIELTGACQISGPIKARCVYGLTFIGDANAPDAVKPSITYSGTGPRGIDLRGVQNFRSVGVAYATTGPGTLVDLTVTKTCTENGLRACDTDADCSGTCDTGTALWASNVYFDLGRFSAPCSDNHANRLLHVRHIVNLNLDRNVFRGGAHHIYGVDSDDEWTSVVNLSRNYFYNAGRSSVFNLRWATNSSGNFWQPQGCQGEYARAFDRSPGVTVEGFYSHADSFWDVAPVGDFVESAPWIDVAGKNINISSRFESAFPGQMAQAVKVAQGSNGVSIVGSYCKNLSRCWNLANKVHRNVTIMGNGYNNVGATIDNNSVTGCSVSTASTQVCD